MDIEKQPVFRLTQEAYDTLRVMSKENPSFYLDPDADFHQALANQGLTDYSEETGVFFDYPISLTLVQSGPRHRADRQALDFHRSLSNMTSRTAADPLMWTWMNHFVLHAYSIERWPRYSTELTKHNPESLVCLAMRLRLFDKTILLDAHGGLLKLR